MDVKHGEVYTLKVTSVLGHIMGLSFPDSYKNWNTVPIESLYDGKLFYFIVHFILLIQTVI